MELRNREKIISVFNSVADSGPGCRFVDHKNAVYLYRNGCLFPSVKNGQVLSIHAVIPKQYRGKNAVKSAKEAIDWAIKSYGLRVVVARIDKNRKNVNLFARMVGMSHYKTDNLFNYYEIQA